MTLNKQHRQKTPLFGLKSKTQIGRPDCASVQTVNHHCYSVLKVDFITTVAAVLKHHKSCTWTHLFEHDAAKPSVKKK